MSIVITPFTAKDAATWDRFLPLSRNGTIFHSRKFLSYHPEGRFTDASLMLHDGHKLVGILPAAIKEEKGKKILVSHPGASYGGLVVLEDASVEETGAMMNALIAHAKEKKYDALSLLRVVPSSLHRMYSEDQLYWAYQLGFQMTRCEMDGAIDLHAFAHLRTSEKLRDELMATLTSKCRNKVRQAEKAKITVRLSDDFASYWPILESVLDGRHGAKPTHTLAEIQSLHKLLPKGFRLLAAFEGEKMIAGTVLVTIHDRALYTLYMAQEYASQEKHPMHLLVTEAMLLAVKEGKNVLHLGVSTEDGGTKINEGLFYFKESFGCRPVRRESWELHF